ncbi:MAG: sugar phosphate nucleotidyltransferase [candidate division KSB1 bacterium]|nr:sugar phosphate nucleotidyltransferase [candidate division KSB1 bacterium]MDZ7301946.1 sugar phosphate nucleotidyltransferase [candidate division KSB1 bacterium]MDZ7312351.1 sugar phosphate nucleotidyltransferase [candidate division KSB1 bacterium]
MKAILLAGGVGTRLRPITLTRPKPLLPIGNRPIIQRIVSHLRSQGIKEFVFLLYYQPQQFMETLGDGKKYHAVFHYVVMEKDLSTAGSVKFARDHIRKTTLIYSADILADLPLRRMLKFHNRRHAMVTLALHPITTPLPYGLVLRERDGRIRRFFEKPTWPQVFSDWINTGIYLIEPELLEHIPDDSRPIFFEQEVFPPLAAGGAAIFGFPLTGYWRDVGTPEDLRLANLDYLQGKLPKKVLLPDEQQLLKGENLVVVGNNSTIAPDAHIESSVIGAGSRIESHARIHGSVIFDEVHIGQGAQVNGAIIMSGVEIEAKAEIHHNSVIAEAAHIGAAAIVTANATVRNNQKIAPGEIVHAKRVLPTGYLRRFVDGGNLVGSVAGGMTSDFMRWVGKAFALRQLKNADLRSSNTDSPTTFLLTTQEEERFSVWARGLAQGMLSAGCEVHLLESVTLPVARWTLLKGHFAGGIYLGADRYAELLRLALLHSTGEDFTTEESCSLERIDLVDAPVSGNLRLLEALPVREDYLRMVLNHVFANEDLSSHRFVPQPGSVLDRALPVCLGVVGYATEQTVSKFCAMLGLPAKILAFPLDMSDDFRRRTRNAQKSFAETVAVESGVGFWIGGVGERIQMALPGHGMLERGRSDALAALLLVNEISNAQFIAGWLFPEISKTLPPRIRRHEGCMLTTAKLRPTNAAMHLIGFDGRGAISFPAPIPSASDLLNTTNRIDSFSAIVYPDALMALAFLLRALAKISPAELEALVPDITVGYRLMPCPDEAKAYLMRRLVECYDHLGCAFSDGIRLEEKNGRTNGAASNWVVVRPCAGLQALEIYWEEHSGPPSNFSKEKTALSVAVRRQLARWRADYASS